MVVAGTFAFSVKSTPRKRRRAARHQACGEIPSTNVLLRGGANGIRALSADQEAWSRLHRGGPLTHPEKARRSGKDEPARCGRLGQVIARRGLTAVWVPDERHEAVRDLSRAREAAQ